MSPISWLVTFVILVAIEFATMALTTIWFAAGALVSFVLALAGASWKLQMITFLVVSFVCLFFTRPVAAKYINRYTKATNVDSLIGKQARITSQVNNDLGTGSAVLDGQEWSARSFSEDEIYEPGTTVVVKEIRGVKLIVEKVKGAVL